MTISNVTSNYASTLGTQTATTTKETDSLGRDAFLTMLVAQMKNQDPLNPMDGTDFTAQLAQFSSLEQLFNVNDNLESLQASLSPESEKNLLDYIGKEVTFEGTKLTVTDGTAKGGWFEVSEAAHVVVNVYDSTGTLVTQIDKGQKAAGKHDLNWNGTDSYGDLVPDGAYTFDAIAYDAHFAQVEVNTTGNGSITGVTYQYDTPYLLMGTQLVDPDTVTKVSLIGSDA